MNQYMYQIALQTLSSFDSGKKPSELSEPERFYHRYVLEFKVRNARREKNLEETVREALRQIDERDYDAELTCKGFPKEKIRHYGFAFEGKRVLIGK